MKKLLPSPYSGYNHSTVIFMRHIDDIDDPTWHDLFDREDLIKKLDQKESTLKDLVQKLERENSLLLDLIRETHPELPSILDKYSGNTLSSIVNIISIHLLIKK